MAYTNHQINALITLEPAKAKKIILAAFKESKMHRQDAAKALECNYGTLLRWIDRLGIHDEINRMTKLSKKEGWHHGRKGGRPVGTGTKKATAKKASKKAVAAVKAPAKTRKVKKTTKRRVTPG